MFNHFSKQKSIPFLSNPNLPDKFVLKSVLDPNSGNAVQVLACEPDDHRSPLECLIYNETTMSLRSKINLGIPLKQVPMPSLDNDPAVSLKKISEVEQRISEQILDLENSSDDVPHGE